MSSILLLTALILAEPQSLAGKVVAITDGDTVKILVDEKQVVIRLEGIDAPERKQPFGTKSREHLAELCHEKEARVVVTGKDRYQRTLGTVYVGELNCNEEMVKNGLAWHYKRFSKDAELAKIEVEAREAKRGLWVDKEPVPPWEWRSKRRQ